jgi:hypothetical protein
MTAVARSSRNERPIVKALSDITHATGPLANKLADHGSPLAERAEKIAAQMRNILASAKRSKQI